MPFVVVCKRLGYLVGTQGGPMTVGGENYQRIIEEGLIMYPKSLELFFWKKYFSYRLSFDGFSQDDCEGLMEKYKEDSSIVPYFFLYQKKKEKYKSERDQLLKQCKELPTAKHQYIQSIID